MRHVDDKLLGNRPLKNRPILGIHFSRRSHDELIDQMLHEEPPAVGVSLVLTANVDHVVHLRRNAGFYAAYRSATHATIDGTPVFWFSRLVGSAIPEKVTGSDIVANLLSEMRRGRLRPAFIVGSKSIEVALRQYLAKRGFENEDVLVEVASEDFGTSLVSQEMIASKVREWVPTHLFVALGAPKSELWVWNYLSDLECWALCCGAGLEFALGLQRRAPKSIRRLGLEWLWRLAHDPARLWKRYLVRPWAAIPVLAQDFVARGRPAQWQRAHLLEARYLARRRRK